MDTGDALVAVRPFQAGEPIFAFSHVSWRPARDGNTVEDPRGRHVYDPLLARVAHSCAPNCRPSFELMALIARRDIAAGEILTFDYLSTESAIFEPFDCGCGAPDCRGRIERVNPVRHSA
jgi:SET domain-containing protein